MDVPLYKKIDKIFTEVVQKREKIKSSKRNVVSNSIQQRNDYKGKSFSPTRQLEVRFNHSQNLNHHIQPSSITRLT